MAEAVRPVETVLFELQPRLLAVRRSVHISPRMVRITLAGADLVDFQTLAAADHVKLFFPEPGVEQPIMPTLSPRGLLGAPVGGPRPVYRDYTVRAYRPAQHELDIDFVLHGAGPAVTWAATATPGRLVGVLGPRGSHVMPRDFDWYLLAGDETALPAIGRWLEELPDTARAIAVIEVEDAAEEQSIASAARVDLVWLHRNGQPAGTTTLLEEAVRGLALPDGAGYVWIAGEAGALKPIRRHLRRERGLPPAWVEVDGYWRRGVENLDHHAADDDDDDE